MQNGICCDDDMDVEELLLELAEQLADRQDVIDYLEWREGRILKPR